MNKKAKRTRGQLLVDMAAELERRIDMERAAAPVGSEFRGELGGALDLAEILHGKLKSTLCPAETETEEN
jgi:hypothetical protein